MKMDLHEDQGTIISGSSEDLHEDQGRIITEFRIAILKKIWEVGSTVTATLVSQVEQTKRHTKSNAYVYYYEASTPL